MKIFRFLSRQKKESVAYEVSNSSSEKKDGDLHSLNNVLELELKVLELELDNYHVMIEGQFVDGLKSIWIIDTGASKSVLDKNLSEYYTEVETSGIDEFQSAGINEGMVDTQVGELKSVKFGNLKLNNLTVALIDLSHVNEIYSKYSDMKIAGLIGGDILMKYKATIDYNAEKIRFVLPADDL